VQVCDLDYIAAYFGYASAVSPEMTAMAKIPFSEGFMSLLAKKTRFPSQGKNRNYQQMPGSGLR